MEILDFIKKYVYITMIFLLIVSSYLIVLFTLFLKVEKSNKLMYIKETYMIGFPLWH